MIVERRGECGPAVQKLAPPRNVPVAFPTTGNSSTIGAQRGASQGQLASQGHLESSFSFSQPRASTTEQFRSRESSTSHFMDRTTRGFDGVYHDLLYNSDQFLCDVRRIDGQLQFSGSTVLDTANRGVPGVPPR